MFPISLNNGCIKFAIVPLLVISILLIGISIGIGYAPKEAIEDTNILHALDWGINRSELQEITIGKGQFQFRVLYQNQIYECVSYPFVFNYKNYYFLFHENSLVSIHGATDFYKSQIIEYQGSPMEIEAPWITEKKLEGIISNPSLTIDAFKNQLEEHKAKKDLKNDSISDSNIWPIAIAYRIFGPALGVLGLFKNDIHENWRTEYNPEKIKLRMTEAEIKQILGKPTFEIGTGVKKTIAFGPDDSFWSRDSKDMNLQGGVEEFWISVTFEDNKAVGIFSDDLFNRDEIVKYSNYVE